MTAASTPGFEVSLTDDCVQPYLIDSSGLNGRMVKLGKAVTAVLNRHNYPDPVAHLLAEMLALGAGLSAALKFDGVFTLQTKGDGPVPMLVADVTSDGAMRGFAQVKDDIPPADEVADAPVPKLLGQGYLAFTVDQGPHTERYQGIVQLDGPTVEECVHHYFQQSDQFASAVKLAAGRDGAGNWRAASLLLQRLPEEGGFETIGSGDEDDWRRALILMASATDKEMLDPAIEPNRLLYRLFHEDGVRVFEPRPLAFGCRCSRERVGKVLVSLGREALDEVRMDDGSYEVVCQFCNSVERFTDADLERVEAELAESGESVEFSPQSDDS